MTNSGDAAEQIVRMSLEGTEVALKLRRALCRDEKPGQDQNQGPSEADRHAEKW